MPTPLSAITWNASQADLNVTYSFFSEGITVENDGESFTSTVIDAFFMAQILSVFETISQYTNLTFTAAADATADATDFQIMLTNDLTEGTDGFMNPPGETNPGLGVFNAAPDFLFETGAYNYMVVVHEVMHGLGLAHPHDDGGSSDILTGVTEDFDDYGDFDLNQGVYTVMSYNNGFPLGNPAPDSKEYGYETGPMALDVAALQAKYGVNATWASSDNAYEIVGTNAVGTGWTTIWDTAGTDSIFYSGSLNVTIDLRPATLEYEVGGGGFVSSVEGIAGGYTIANGVTIEDATGASGDDMLTGNALANMLMGNGGMDWLFGGEGDDNIDGGDGMDTAAYSGMQSSYTVVLSASGTTVQDRRADGDGTDTLANIEMLGFDSDDPFNLAQVNGAAGLSEANMETFIDLYIAYFDRAPDAIGLNFWATAFNNGTSLEQMASLFIDQDETRERYPSTLTNEEFATTIYDDVLGRIPDQAGFDFWVGVLNGGAVSRDQFLLEVLRGAEASPPEGATQEFITQQAADRLFLENKTDIGTYFAVTKGMSDVANASSVMALFDGSQESLNAAVAATDDFYAAALDGDTGAFLMPLVGVLDDPFAVA